MPEDPSLSARERAEAVRLLTDESGSIAALAYVRRATGVSLARGLEIVRLLQREAGLLPEPPAPDETSAEIIAVGPFRSDLLEHLEYPADFYEGTRDGATITETVDSAEQDSGATRALAACFGIDPWDFNSHELDASAADLDALRAYSGDGIVERFVALRAAGFRFYFNGPDC